MSLITMPFDSTQGNLKEYPASTRRMLYRDLWSDMVVEQFTFQPTGGGNFIVNGAGIVQGAYFRFSDHQIATTGVQLNWTRLHARIVSDGQGGQTVGLRMMAGSVAGELLVGRMTVQAGPQVTAIDGVAPSPIRIPDRTVTGAKLVDNAIANRHLANDVISNRVLANNSVSNRNLANNSVGASALASNSVGISALTNGGVTAPAIASNAVTTAKIANRAVTVEKLPGNLFRLVRIEQSSSSSFTWTPNQLREITYTAPSGWNIAAITPTLNGVAVGLGGSLTNGYRILMRNVRTANINITPVTATSAAVGYVRVLLVRTVVQSFETITRSAPVV